MVPVARSHFVCVIFVVFKISFCIVADSDTKTILSITVSVTVSLFGYLNCLVLVIVVADSDTIVKLSYLFLVSVTVCG